jgi:hypothetical protein
MVRVTLNHLLCISGGFLAVALFDGCASHELFRNAPVLSRSVSVTAAATLQPTFEWTAPNKSGVSYDLIIYVGTKDPRGFWVPGKKAYYREGITTSRHTVGQPLSPDTLYFWSVRTRFGNRTSPWATYDDGNPKLSHGGWPRYNMMCPFKTPGK